MEFLQFIQGIDDTVVIFFQLVSSVFFKNLMAFFSAIQSDGALWIGIAVVFAVLALLKKIDKKGFYVAGGIVLALGIDIVLCLLLKEIFPRPRPYIDIPNVVLWIDPQPGTSFPSAHSSTAFAAATALALLVPKRIKKPSDPSAIGVLPGSEPMKKNYYFIAVIAAYVVAALIALSRVALCVHYFSDAVCGIVIGILCGIAVAYFVNLFYKKQTAKEKK